MAALAAPTLDAVWRARQLLEGLVVRTPTLVLETDSRQRIALKLENLQPIGSFKIRGAGNKILSSDRPAGGVYTASAGNMAQGVACVARELEMKATVFVPDSAPRAKTDAVERLGARIERVPYDEWWKIMQEHGRPGTPGLFVHPFADNAVLAGNATIALEIIEDRPEVDAVFVPWGGGGLTCGIAAGLRAIKASPRVYACEVEGAAPLSASRAAGRPVTIDNRRSFIDGMGGRGVFPEMWPLAQELVTDTLVVTVEQVAAAVRMIAERGRVVAEGAGAAPLAAALAYADRLTPRPRSIVCVVSGGNIDTCVLSQILAGNVPSWSP